MKSYKIIPRYNPRYYRDIGYSKFLLCADTCNINEYNLLLYKKQNFVRFYEKDHI